MLNISLINRQHQKSFDLLHFILKYIYGQKITFDT